MKYKKKPIVIEAHQLPGINERADSFLRWANSVDFTSFTSERYGRISIETLEGTMEGSPLDWIIKGINGEFYPCKSDIFKATYEKVVE